MTPDPLIAFPLGALALVIFFPLFGRRSGKTISKSLRSRAQRRRRLGQTAVVVMVLAAVVSAVWPLWPTPPFGRFMQALLICTVVLVPLLVANGIAARRWRGRSVATRGAVGGRDAYVPNAMADFVTRPDAPVEPARTRPARTASARTARGTPVSRPAPVPGGAVAGATPGGGGPGRAMAGSGNEGFEQAAPAGDRAVGQTGGVVGGEDSVSAQLARLTTLVDSYEFGGEGHPSREGGGAARPAGERAGALSTPYVSGSTDTSRANVDMEALRSTVRELHQMTRREVAGLVSSLRGDKVRLQKLIIAQQAAYDSERQAHDKTRTVARDAVSIMRIARDSQKLAEKAARRERRKRLHIEEKYDRIARALDNAVSMTERRTEQP